MKKLVFTMGIVFSMASFAQETEVHFEDALVKKCSVQVESLGCGTPTASNEPTFMKCVDQKISKLSQECQTLHKTIRAHSHSH